MIAVRMNRAMRPWGAGDIAMLPEDVAEKVIDAGDGELVDMPDAPHAHEAMKPGTQVFKPQQDKPRRGRPPKQTYLTRSA